MPLNFRGRANPCRRRKWIVSRSKTRYTTVSPLPTNPQPSRLHMFQSVIRSNLFGQEPPLCRRSYEQSTGKRCERHQKPEEEPNSTPQKTTTINRLDIVCAVFSEQQRSVELRRRLLPEACVMKNAPTSLSRKQSSERHATVAGHNSGHTVEVASSRAILYNDKVSICDAKVTHWDC